MSICWVLIISSLPATPGESESDVAFQLGSVAILGKSERKTSLSPSRSCSLSLGTA